MGKTGAFIRADEVLHGQLRAGETVALDEAHGNADMLRGVAALDMAGPFGAAGPWELEDERGVRRLHACGFGAVPFGERPPELVEFLRQYLETGRSRRTRPRPKSPSAGGHPLCLSRGVRAVQSASLP